MARRSLLLALFLAPPAALGLGVGCGGCAGKPKPPPRATEPSRTPGQEGIASHYAARFAGRPTASGQPYQPDAMTAAHRTLPLGTRVRVTRIDRKGTRVAGPIEVVINDRGPYHDGRIIDLSEEGARRLGFHGDIARVRVEPIHRPGR